MGEGGESIEQSEPQDQREGRPGWTRERGWLDSAKWAENELAQRELDELDKPPEHKKFDQKKLDNVPTKPPNLVPFEPLKLPK